MYVPDPDKAAIRRLARWAAWKAGDAAAAVISRITRFRVPDEPLQPFAVKLPMLVGAYERDTVKTIEEIVRPGMVVIDGGAHAGYMTKLLSRLVGPTGKVLAFEIHPGTLALLKSNTSRLANVEIIPAALGPEDGTTKLFASSLSSGHSASPGKPGLKEAGEIPVRSIASVLEERGLPRVDFLKLDIEGGEPPVLRSIPEGPITIVFEVKRYILEATGESPEGLLTEMLDSGFTLRRDSDRRMIQREDLARTSQLFDKANIIAERR